jgi:hypothetical protein
MPAPDLDWLAQASAIDPAPFAAELGELAALSPPLYLMGGIAEEALLHGRLSPHHADLDVLALPAHWAWQAPALVALGFAAAPGTIAQPAAGRPAVLRRPTGSLQVEVWLAVPAPGRGFALDLPRQAPAGFFQLSLPADTFGHPPVTVAGLTLYTVSPLALYLLRAASSLTRGTAQQRERDRAIQAQLRQALLAGYPVIDLRANLADL